MDTDSVIVNDEATIQKFMEDVCLKASDLNSDSSSEITDKDELSTSKNFSQVSPMTKIRPKNVAERGTARDVAADQPDRDPLANYEDEETIEINDNDNGDAHKDNELTTEADSDSEREHPKSQMEHDKSLNPEGNSVEEMQEENVFTDTEKERSEDTIEK